MEQKPDAPQTPANIQSQYPDKGDKPHTNVPRTDTNVVPPRDLGQTDMGVVPPYKR